jgi:hypothetical protein
MFVQKMQPTSRRDRKLEFLQNNTGAIQTEGKHSKYGKNFPLGSKKGDGACNVDKFQLYALMYVVEKKYIVASMDKARNIV